MELDTAMSPIPEIIDMEEHKSVKNCTCICAIKHPMIYRVNRITNMQCYIRDLIHMTYSLYFFLFGEDTQGERRYKSGEIMTLLYHYT